MEEACNVIFKFQEGGVTRLSPCRAAHVWHCSLRGCLQCGQTGGFPAAFGGFQTPEAGKNVQRREAVFEAVFRIGSFLNKITVFLLEMC